MNILRGTLVAGFALLGLVACNKKDNSTVYRGRIINSICASTTIQFIDGINLGQNNWTDAFDSKKPVYNHVFRLANHCDAGLGMHTVNDTISFRLVAPTNQQCAQCMATGCTPELAMYIRVVE